MKKHLCVLISIIIIAISLCACSKSAQQQTTATETYHQQTEQTEQAAEIDTNREFRVTAYVVGDRILNYDSFDTSHFSQLTDVVLFGVARYDEDGNVNLLDNFATAYKNIKKACETYPDINLYLNILGPGYNTDSSDRTEQMNSLSERNTNAFNSGRLQEEILDIMKEYSFDGVFFDYEFPLKKKHWEAFDAFLISLDKTLGKDYKIGIAVADWNVNQSKNAIAATDFVEVMAYDIWDDDGTHASLKAATNAIEKMVNLGYEKSQLDLGLPFYARPTTEEKYWYEYKRYYDRIDENGFYDDNKTELTFSFNTADVVAEKTAWAIDNGIGGMMIWHYSCDLPRDNEKSLLNAVYDIKQEKLKNFQD